MKQTALPPAPKGVPLLGNALQFQSNPLRFLREVQHAYPRMATIYAGKEPLVLCFRPEHIRAVLVENPHNFVKLKRKEPRFNLRLLLGEGLLTTDGDFHRQQRRLVH
jgi:cytochrome P450